MKTILCDRERPAEIGDQVRDGDFSYRLEFGWAKWPAELEGVHTLNGSFDQDGNLYVATENKEHPVVVLSPDGAFQRSIGGGLFEKAHSIFLTPSHTILVADSSKNCHVIGRSAGAGLWDHGTAGGLRL